MPRGLIGCAWKVLTRFVKVFVHGPSVTLPLGEEELSIQEGWVGLREVGMAQANGTWKVIPMVKYKA